MVPGHYTVVSARPCLLISTYSCGFPRVLQFRKTVEILQVLGFVEGVVSEF